MKSPSLVSAQEYKDGGEDGLGADGGGGDGDGGGGDGEGGGGEGCCVIPVHGQKRWASEWEPEQSKELEGCQSLRVSRRQLPLV